MKKIILKGTNLNVSRLGLGTASLHHLYPKTKRLNLLKTALDNGFTHFDTAPMYGEGLAESDLGSFLGCHRQHISISTKIGYAARLKYPSLLNLYALKTQKAILKKIGCKSREYRSLELQSIKKSFEDSLRRLKTDYVDILLIHEPISSDFESLKAMQSWLENQKKMGKVKYIGLAGLANNTLGVYKQFNDIFDIVQIEDDLSGSGSELFKNYNDIPQITYGFFRNNNTLKLKANIIGAALRINTDGLILVSTRRTDRVISMAREVNNFYVN